MLVALDDDGGLAFKPPRVRRIISRIASISVFCCSSTAMSFSSFSYDGGRAGGHVYAVRHFLVGFDSLGMRNRDLQHASAPKRLFLVLMPKLTFIAVAKRVSS